MDDIFDGNASDCVGNGADEEEKRVVSLIVAWSLGVVGDQHAIGVEVPSCEEDEIENYSILNFVLLHL